MSVDIPKSLSHLTSSDINDPIINEQSPDEDEQQAMKIIQGSNWKAPHHVVYSSGELYENVSDTYFFPIYTLEDEEDNNLYSVLK